MLSNVFNYFDTALIKHIIEQPNKYAKQQTAKVSVPSYLTLGSENCNMMLLKRCTLLQADGNSTEANTKVIKQQEPPGCSHTFIPETLII
jgi:hypothetical protein